MTLIFICTSSDGKELRRFTLNVDQKYENEEKNEKPEQIFQWLFCINFQFIQRILTPYFKVQSIQKDNSTTSMVTSSDLRSW